ALVPARERHRARAGRETGEIDVRRRDLVAAGEFLGDRHRRLVGIAPRAQEERLLQRARDDLADAFGELDLLDVVDAAARVDQRLAALLDRGDDARIVVTERRAHL